MTECTVCLGKHDEEIHEATLRVREWQLSKLKMALAVVEKGQPKVGGPSPHAIGLAPKGPPSPDWPNRA